MKFFTILKNRHGEFGINALAAQLDMKLGRYGDFVGWLTQEEIEIVRESGFSYYVAY